MTYICTNGISIFTGSFVVCWLLVDHCQVLHHMLSLISIVYAMYSGEGQLYTYMVLISETTTPGINLRWYVLKRMHNVFFYITSMYLTCDCSVIKVSWYCWVEKIQGLSCQWCCNVCCLAGMLLQCNWMLQVTNNALLAGHTVLTIF